MSEENTRKTNGSRSFEERVFARFDSMDERFDRLETRLASIESRVDKLEARQYDTKPIWEKALAAIEETNREMRIGFDTLADTLRSEIAVSADTLADTLRTEMASSADRLRSEFAASANGLRAELGSVSTKMDSGFQQLRTELDFALRGVGHKIDVLNQNMLELKAEQRYFDSRIEKLETPPKPS